MMFSHDNTVRIPDLLIQARFLAPQPLLTIAGYSYESRIPRHIKPVPVFSCSVCFQMVVSTSQRTTIGRVLFEKLLVAQTHL